MAMIREYAKRLHAGLEYMTPETPRPNVFYTAREKTAKNFLIADKKASLFNLCTALIIYTITLTILGSIAPLTAISSLAFLLFGRVVIDDSFNVTTSACYGTFVKNLCDNHLGLKPKPWLCLYSTKIVIFYEVTRFRHPQASH